MTKDKKLKIGSIISDIALFGFLMLIALTYLLSLYGIHDGIPTGFYAEGHLVYGWEAYLETFARFGFFSIFIPVPFFAICYDIVFLIIKCSQKYLRKYQLIGIIATFLLIIVGVVLCVLSGKF